MLIEQRFPPAVEYDHFHKGNGGLVEQVPKNLLRQIFFFLELVQRPPAHGAHQIAATRRFDMNEVWQTSRNGSSFEVGPQQTVSITEVLQGQCVAYEIVIHEIVRPEDPAIHCREE
jgi:hypothetical protein